MPESGEGAPRFIFPGAKTLSDHARSLDVDELATKELQTERNRREIKEKASRITVPWFDSFKALAEAGDFQDRKWRLPGVKPGKKVIKWSDQIQGLRLYKEPITVLSSLYFDRDPFVKLQSYELDLRNRENRKGTKLDVKFGEEDISKITMHWNRNGVTSYELNDLIGQNDGREPLPSMGNRKMHHIGTTFIPGNDYGDAFIALSLGEAPQIDIGWTGGGRGDYGFDLFKYNPEKNTFDRRMTPEKIKKIRNQFQGLSTDESITAQDFIELISDALSIIPAKHT